MVRYLWRRLIAMPLAPHQKSVVLIMWARLLSYVAFFALPLTAALGWKRVMPHQIEIGLVGFVFFFWFWSENSPVPAC